MRTIDRYLLDEFFKVLGTAILSFVLIYLIVDFLEKIDDFLEVSLPLVRVAYFFMLSVPTIFFNVAPVAILVSTLICLGLLARHSEIVALKAAGIGIFRISLPILRAAFLFSLLLFVLSEAVIPYTTEKANAIWKLEVEKQQDTSSGRYEDIWLKGNGAIHHFSFFDQPNGYLRGVSLYRLDQNFRLYERIEADEARLIDGAWVLFGGLVKSYRSGGDLQVTHFKEQIYQLPDLSRDFSRTRRGPEEMNLEELLRSARQVETEGHDPVRFLVDLHLKVSYPFICFIMAFIGLPLAFWREKGSGITLGIGMGIGLSFIYFVILGLSRSLGYSGLLTPIAAAWLPNIFFIFLGLFLFAFARR